MPRGARLAVLLGAGGRAKKYTRGVDNGAALPSEPHLVPRSQGSKPNKHKKPPPSPPWKRGSSPQLPQTAISRQITEHGVGALQNSLKSCFDAAALLLK